MNISVKVPESLNSFLDCLKPGGRKSLFSVAANALKIEVQSHIRRDAPRRHVWADKLGGKKTNHLTKGAARVSFAADENHGEVTIPIAGIGRAFHDVTITPRNGTSLTIPIEGPAYGHRVAELRRMGWAIFRPHGQDALWGSHDADDDPMPLYLLRKRVTQRQDRTLLPSDQTINSVVARAMISEIQRVSRKSS